MQYFDQVGKNAGLFISRDVGQTIVLCRLPLAVLIHEGNTNMASPAQMAANRRNAQKSTGPRSIEGKKRASLNHLRHGMTAKTIVLPHECAADYEEIRAALIKDYEPATTQELMLVDQIAAGYWRTIRARRFETEMFDNRLRTRKRELGMDPKPDPGKDDEGYAVMLQVTDPEELKNYFRYDATISRDYYRAIATLEKMQARRKRTASVSERTNPTPTPEDTDDEPAQSSQTARVYSIGFVPYSTTQQLSPSGSRSGKIGLQPGLPCCAQTAATDAKMERPDSGSFSSRNGLV